MTAQAVDKDVRKRALLLHIGGEEVFEIAETEEMGNTYTELKTALTKYFDPQRNVGYEIFTFRQATQQPGETLDKFYIRLKLLSKNCDFRDVNREIKSQIIQKCSLAKVRDKGLSEPAVKLSDLLTYGRTLEATNVQAQATCGTLDPRPDLSGCVLCCVRVLPNSEARRPHAHFPDNSAIFFISTNIC